MTYWVWIGGLLALLVIGWAIDQILYRRRVKREIARVQLEHQQAALKYQQWRASATPAEVFTHDIEVRKRQEMDHLKETNPREWERRLQSQKADDAAQARRRSSSERTKWRTALLGLPITPAVAESSLRSWPIVHEITTHKDLESIVDFLIDQAARPEYPFLLEGDCLASNRDTSISRSRQRYYRVGESVWQCHVESESHD